MAIMSMLLLLGFILLASNSNAHQYPQTVLSTCQRTFQNVGCFKEHKSKDVARDVLINDGYIYGGYPESQLKQLWHHHIYSLACRCAKKANSKGYRFFGLRNITQCYGYAGKDSARLKKHKSNDCTGLGYKDCDSSQDQCTGRNGSEYVYELMKECKDESASCASWKKSGYCGSTYFIRENCKKTCNDCDDTYWWDVKSKTTGGSAGGAPCNFPFIYNGKRYHTCTSIDREKPWCSTSYNDWGYCVGGKPTNPKNTVKFTGNIAKGEQTDQSSSSSPNGPSSNAVDGNMNTNFPTGSSCTKTQKQTGAWWRVKVPVDPYGPLIGVVMVKITNRGDCCWNRLKNFEVRVGDNSTNPKENQLCSAVHGSMGKGETRQLNCSSPIRGMYVFIVGNENDYLTLCEVQVIAVSSDSNFGGFIKIPQTGENLAKDKATAQSSSASNGPSSLAVDGNKGSCTQTQEQIGAWWRVDVKPTFRPFPPARRPFPPARRPFPPARRPFRPFPAARRPFRPFPVLSNDIIPNREDVEWKRWERVSNYILYNITITNRGDADWSRLRNFDIRVGDVANDPKANNLCTSVIASLGRGETRSFSCNASGRYIFIVSNSDNDYLTLCEVQVFGIKRSDNN